MNNEELGWADAVAATYLCGSINTHPNVHSYSNWACDFNSVSSMLRLGSLFIVAMNYQSWLSGFLANREPTNMKTVLAYNVRKGIGCHSKMSAIAPYSRFVRFVLAARPQVRKIIKNCSIAINFEGFLQSSIIHSLDHIGLTRGVDTRALELSQRFRAAELRQFFTEPLEGFFVDTHLSSSQENWAKELYTYLHEYDADLAKEVHYCISF